MFCCHFNASYSSQHTIEHNNSVVKNVHLIVYASVEKLLVKYPQS